MKSWIARHAAALLPLRLWAIGVCGALAVALPAWADPPGRAGRLAEVSGQVWLQSPESGEWIQAPRNRPITSGDRITTESDSRAEVRLGTTTLRVDEQTELEVVTIDDDTVRLRLHSGSVAARLRTGEAAREFSLATPEGEAQTQIAGHYRFDRRDDITEVTAQAGQVHFSGPGAALTVMANQRGEFWRDGSLQYALGEPVRDAFWDWATAQDRQDRGVDAATARYVSPEMTGAEDLDRNGRWETVQEYGPVWYPTVVSAGWAPYRYGHWAWVSPWGWTWVDDAAWGFAPFHYGRWVYHRDRWGWAPGRYTARPVYAPALVAWVGGGHGSVSVSVGGPPVGWFPLAPREAWVPPFRFTEAYIRRVNGAVGVQISSALVRDPIRATAGWHYAHQGPRGLTAVPPEVMRRREPVRPGFAALGPNAWRDLERGRVRYDMPLPPPAVRPAPSARPPGLPAFAGQPPGWRGPDRDRDRDRDGGFRGRQLEQDRNAARIGRDDNNVGRIGRDDGGAARIGRDEGGANRIGREPARDAGWDRDRERRDVNRQPGFVPAPVVTAPGRDIRQPDGDRNDGWRGRRGNDGDPGMRPGWGGPRRDDMPPRGVGAAPMQPAPGMPAAQPAPVMRPALPAPPVMQMPVQRPAPVVQPPPVAPPPQQQQRVMERPNPAAFSRGPGGPSHNEPQTIRSAPDERRQGPRER